MKCEIVKITPQLAKSWLEQNANFREPIPNHIKTMAKDMKAGKWDENGETIKFNSKDQLVDGQNRLMACIEADTPFVSVVVYDVKSDLNIDVGSKRALKQWLKHHGVESYSQDVSASLRALSIFQASASFNHSGVAGSTKPTNHDLVNLLKRTPEIKTSVLRVQKLKNELVRCSLIAPLHLLFEKKDAELAEKFICALENKIELSNSDPVMLLRDRLLHDRSSKAKLGQRGIAALIIIAWNHWRNGTSTKNLLFRDSGPGKQDFPEIE